MPGIYVVTSRDLTQRRVRLLGGLSVNAGANAATLGRALKRGAGSLVTGGRAALLDELMERRHSNSLYFYSTPFGQWPFRHSKLWQAERREIYSRV